MWPYYPELLARPVPRYTSYPTALEFSGDTGPDDLAEALGETSGDLSIYVHIPFCERICWYCGCNTGAANRRERLTSYLDALRQEIALAGKLLGSGARVRRISFGGGSPNAITPVDFVRLVGDLTIHLPLADPIWSIELDPRTLDSDWGRVIAGVGIQRASLGVQTLSPRLQAAIGRVQPPASIERAVDLLREAGISSLNFDLMYGLPGQDRSDLEETIDSSITLGADRVALFGYAHVPARIPRQRKIDASNLPGPEERFHMAELGHNRLAAAGYVSVGFDHFALPFDPLAQAAARKALRRNFQGFTDDAAPALAGFGASAISCFPDQIIQNEKNTGRYGMILSQSRLPVALGLRRDADDRLRGEIISGLLCHGEARIAPAMMAGAIEGIEKFRSYGLVEVQRERLVILPDGLPYSRAIAALFDAYLNGEPKRFSSAI